MPATPFVDRFASFWEAPGVDRMEALLHEDVVLVQPLAPPLEGLAAAREEFARIFALIPDLHAEVDGSVADGDLVHVEFRLRGHLGRRWVEWPVVDVIRLRAGKAVRRETYFDPLPLILALLRTPSAWWRWWRSGAARPYSGARPRG